MFPVYNASKTVPNGEGHTHSTFENMSLRKYEPDSFGYPKFVVVTQFTSCVARISNYRAQYGTFSETKSKRDRPKSATSYQIYLTLQGTQNLRKRQVLDLVAEQGVRGGREDIGGVLCVACGVGRHVGQFVRWWLRSHPWASFSPFEA